MRKKIGRLIDADILITELKESALHHCNNPREDSLLQRDRVIVRAQPTVEAVPVIHAKWIFGEADTDGIGNNQYICSHCGHGDIHADDVVVNYCWYCGAKMDLK